ncbi:MAG: tyrosine-type recombinase/integrase [Anaerolineales bacterium]|nr:tyrosine-type recombinase/integrase [Anaerolineales bacterium]
MQDYVEDFLEEIRSRLGYSKSTYLAYATDLRRFMGYLQQRSGDSPRLADFSASQIAAFLEAERQVGCNRSTLLRRRAALQSFAAFLQRRGALPQSPFEFHALSVLEPIVRARPQNRAECLSPVQIEALNRLMRASQRPRASRDHAILSLLLETGISIGRLVNLDLADVAVEKGRVSLNLQPQAGFWFRLGAASKPMINYLNDGRLEFIRQAVQPALFLNQTGQRVSRQGVWQMLQYWGRAASLPLSLSPRLARNTAAVSLFRAGVPLEAIQSLLGHRNPHSTQALLHRLAKLEEDEG